MSRVAIPISATIPSAKLRVVFTLPPSHFIAAPHWILLVSITTAIGHLEDAANSSLCLFAIRGGASRAELVAVSAPAGAPSLQGVLSIQVHTIQCSRELRQSPPVFRNWISLSAAACSFRLVIVPSSAGAQFAVVLWRASDTFGVLWFKLAGTAPVRRHP